MVSAVVCVVVLSFNAMPHSLVVIVPGGQDDRSFPAWPQDLALAINQTFPNPSSARELGYSQVNLSVAMNPKASPHFILFDWSAVSRLADIADEPEVAGVLRKIIEQKIDFLKARGIKDIDLTLIGHSRGCYVICAALRGFDKNYQGLKFVHMVTLDPHAYGFDGILEANPGNIVDWATNYYQRVAAPMGLPLAGALNINLSAITVAWHGRNPTKPGACHSEIHDWYHGTFYRTYNGKARISPYQDLEIVRQEAQFDAEAKNPKIFLTLYGTNPVIENFNGSDSPHLDFSQGRGDRANHITLLERSTTTMNRIVKGALEIIPPERSLAASALLKTVVTGEFVAEFSLQMKKESGSLSADGIAFVMLDADKPFFKVGLPGGSLGYGGMNGLALAFDTYSNPEFSDPKDPASRVSLRVNGLPQWREFSTTPLPEPLSQGNRFRVRVTLHGLRRALTVRIYSHGADRGVLMEGKLPAEFTIPRRMRLGFTASTGTFSQRHIIDDITVVW